MKVEELYIPDRQSQIGIVFERVPFETKLEIFPQLNPYMESVRSGSGEVTMCELASVETQDQLARAVKNQVEDSEFHGIPIKLGYSEPLPNPGSQEPSTSEVGEVSTTVSSDTKNSSHAALLEEIDSAVDLGSVQERQVKKGSTLSRMLKGIRGEKVDEGSEKQDNTKPLNKILQRVNPVGRSSRENISKMLHRIGDALQRKGEEDGDVLPDGTKPKDKISKGDKSRESSRLGKFGDKVFKFRTTEPDKGS